MIMATGWTQDFALVAPHVTAWQQIFLPLGEVLLFAATAYFAPNMIAGLVSGGAGPSINTRLSCRSYH
jgi:hypothetical protein